MTNPTSPSMGRIETLPTESRSSPTVARKTRRSRCASNRYSEQTSACIPSAIAATIWSKASRTSACASPAMVEISSMSARRSRLVAISVIQSQSTRKFYRTTSCCHNGRGEKSVDLSASATSKPRICESQGFSGGSRGSRQLESSKCILQETAARSAPAAPDRFDEPAFIMYRRFEQSTYTADGTRGMGVGARNLGLLKMPRHPQREHILLLGAGAVQHLDRVDELEDCELGGAVGAVGIDRLAVRIDEGKARVELVAKRMVGDQDSARRIHHLAQLRELVDSTHVAIEAEHPDVPHVGGHLHAAQEHYPRLAAQEVHLARFPHGVVLGDADRADPNRAGARDQVRRRKVRIRTAAAGVEMKVYAEVGPRRVPASGCHHLLLLGRLRGERDFLHVIALLNLVDHVHPFDHAAKDRVVAVKARLRLQANVELAARGFPFGIHVVAGARGRHAPAQVMFVLVDFGRNRVTGATHSGAVRVTALHHEVGHHAVKGEAIVEAFLG